MTAGSGRCTAPLPPAGGDRDHSVLKPTAAVFTKNSALRDSDD